MCEDYFMSANILENNTASLRSRDWFGRKDLQGLSNRAYLRAEGFTSQVFENKPVVGICNSWSELTTCNAHLRQVAEAVKRGVWAAGGFPLEFPTISLGEILMKPTTMLTAILWRWTWKSASVLIHSTPSSFC